jgi:hypothetical protein
MAVRNFRYALPNDDMIYRLRTTAVITASAEDAAYPVSNWLLATVNGVEPERPSKLTTTSGTWTLDFGVAVNIAAVGLLFTNWDAALTCFVAWNSADSWGAPVGTAVIVIPTVPADGTTINPWVVIPGSPTYRYWRISVAMTGTPNSAPLSLGRPLFLGAWRSFVKGVLHEEINPFQKDTSHEVLPPNMTALQIEKPIPLVERRRAMVNIAIGSDDAEAVTLDDIRNSTGGRQFPFPVVPDDSQNDLWWVRLSDVNGTRRFITTNWNIFPFGFREVSRGLEWP